MFHELLKDLAARAARQGTLPRPTPELLRRIWPTLVGEDLAARSRPLRLEDSTLHLAVDHPSLADEWRRSPLPLLRQIRRFSPWTVDTLKIDVDTTLAPAPAPTPPQAAPRDPGPLATPEEIDDDLADTLRRIHILRARRRGQDS